MSDEHDNHGNSLAAWVCVLLLIVAFGLVPLAVGILSVPLAIAGVVAGIIGLVAGKVLSSMGYGIDVQTDHAGH